MSSTDLAICETSSACDQYDGKRIQVIGIYTLYDPYPPNKKFKAPPIVRLELSDENKGPFLEPFWHPQSERTSTEIDKFKGQKVCVTGTYYSSQPSNPDNPEQATSLGGPCIYPVETIVAVN
ncbi:MAG: hypothetical protein AAGC93_20775 [Cyanobacteria bacterium P01_F01_bin.53]